MEIFFETTLYTYKTAYVFSLVSWTPPPMLREWLVLKRGCTNCSFNALCLMGSCFIHTIYIILSRITILYVCTTFLLSKIFIYLNLEESWEILMLCTDGINMRLRTIDIIRSTHDHLAIDFIFKGIWVNGLCFHDCFFSLRWVVGLDPYWFSYLVFILNCMPTFHGVTTFPSVKISFLDFLK